MRDFLFEISFIVAMFATMTSEVSMTPRLVGRVSVGTPPHTVNNVQQLVFDIHDFKNRQELPGQSFCTPSVKAHGHDWCLEIYPRGRDSPQDPQQVVAVDLKHENGRGRIQYRVSIYTGKRKVKFQSQFFPQNVILKELDQYGTLTFVVDVELYRESKTVWYPKKLKAESVLVNLYSTKTAFDGVFQVSGIEFRVHQAILQLRCKHLSDMLEGCGGNPVVIPDIDKRSFEAVLQYVYTVQEPIFDADDDEDFAKAVLVAADRLGVTGLKLFAESEIISEFLNNTNAVRMMFFGDSHSCAFLKEAAFDQYVKYTWVVRQSKDWAMMRESVDLLEELLVHCTETCQFDQ